jgi:hypothetical protein
MQMTLLGGAESVAAVLIWVAHGARILKAHPLPGDSAPKRSLMQRVRDLLA